MPMSAAALQAAVSARGTVSLGQGDQPVTAPLIMDAMTRVVGVGARDGGVGTNLYNDGTNPNSPLVKWTFPAQNVFRNALVDLQITNPTGDGLDIDTNQGSSGCLVERVRFDVGGKAIRASKPNLGSTAWNYFLTVHDCQIENPRNVGIEISPIGCLIDGLEYKFGTAFTSSATHAMIEVPQSYLASLELRRPWYEPNIPVGILKMDGTGGPSSADASILTLSGYHHIEPHSVTPAFWYDLTGVQVHCSGMAGFPGSTRNPSYVRARCEVYADRFVSVDPNGLVVPLEQGIIVDPSSYLYRTGRQLAYGAPVASTDPDTCTVFGRTRDESGAIVPTQQLSFRMTRSPSGAGTLYGERSVAATSDASGLFQAELLRLATYRLTWGSLRELINVPDSDLYEVPNLPE
jgi:hypothetical protein